MLLRRVSTLLTAALFCLSLKDAGQDKYLGTWHFRCCCTDHEQAESAGSAARLLQEIGAYTGLGWAVFRIWRIQGNFVQQWREYLCLAVQILVSREGCEDNQRLAKLGPGSLIEVSEVMGRG